MVNLCLSAGVLLSFSYSTIWSSKKTKSSIIFSTILLTQLYILYFIFSNFQFITVHVHIVPGQNLTMYGRFGDLDNGFKGFRIYANTIAKNKLL